MKKLVKRKKIIIPYNGYIRPIGVSGPVEIPYMETFERISEMLMRRIPVYEVLNDGTKVKLNLRNYDKDNGDSDTSSVRKTYEPTNAKRKTRTKQIDDDDVSVKSLKHILKSSTKKIAKSKDYDITQTSFPRVNEASGGPNKIFVGDEPIVER